MTKLRAPLSFDLAITRIAGLLGWDGAASVVGQAERTVRNWSDPDTTARIPLEDALRLDAAYRAAGGQAAPLLECYQLRLDIATAAARGDQAELLAATAMVAKESGEAIAAIIRASQPGATADERARARLEGEEAVGAITNTLSMLREGD
ncbi:hypothetical protein [Sphingomonas profundi]|uniref:hypothetical protein n=1 Tax=Alterirhizorhabdus profundi TaxID=2681549 RepID=UPI0012E72078|nr:hypothetical protein [Sphingomonas profundi]